MLDVPAGHGFFAYEVAKLMGEGEVHAVGLPNDLRDFQEAFGGWGTPGEAGFERLIEYHVMDATRLTFPDGHFDLVVNFLGLEDINMTRGEDGVLSSLSEFVRVLRPGGTLLITIEQEGREPDEVLWWEVARCIGHNAVFHPVAFYTDHLAGLGVEVLEELACPTGRKLTSQQATEELRFTCEETPRHFGDYGVTTANLDDLWARFGERIDRHGMAYYSNLLAIIGRRTGGRAEKR